MSLNVDKLGQILLNKSIVDYNKLKNALEVKEKESANGRRNLAQILVNDFALDPDSIFGEVAGFYGFRKLTIKKEQIDAARIEFIRAVFEQLPEVLQEQMKREKILVYKRDEKSPDKFIIIGADPTNRVTATIARAIGAKKYDVCYVSTKEIQLILDLVFPPENEFLKTIEENQVEITEEDDDDDGLDEAAIEAEINKSVLVNLIEGMLLEAVRQDASDIHIIPIDSRTTEFHFRIDGKLRLWHTREGFRPEAIVAVAKDRSKNVDRFERETAQDGFIQRKVDGHMIRYRVSILPIVSKEYQYKLESVVIRVLDDRKVITDFERLGFQYKSREMFIKAISRPQGMVIVTGPTGSGKSTTLMAALSYVIKPEVNVLTVEDPVEYIIQGARQLKIGPKMDFEQALRSILRHDPDVVMVGEIRDKITAEIGIKLANTGHLTFSTLHTNDAPSAISRLYKMGLETFLIAYAINIIIAQRLIRRLCDHCKRPLRNFTPALALGLGFTQQELEQLTFYEAVGCDKCHGGYKGRVAIHETLYFSKEIRNIIFKAGREIDEEQIRQQAIKEGMMTLRGAGRERVKQGIATLEEIAQATTDD
ncbi:MAG: GspE/PulE family protein [Candidatus Zhuqueibacterota bacterium]